MMLVQRQQKNRHNNNLGATIVARTLLPVVVFVLTLIHWFGDDMVGHHPQWGGQVQQIKDSLLFSPALTSPSLRGSQSHNVVGSSSMPNNLLSTTTLCSRSASFFDTTELQTKAAESLQFHQKGGNLKSVQKFLDEAMDPTLEKLDQKFVFKGEKDGKWKASQELSKYYDEHPNKRMGYGEPLPGKFADDGSKVFHEKRWFDVIEPREKKDKWDASLGPMGPECKNLRQLGKNDKDGYKFICLPPDDEIQPEDECHVISVGGNDNWKFEEAIVKELGCHTYTFDCTLPGGKPQRKPDNNKMHFFDYCIDDHEHEDSFGRKFLPYNEILKLANIQKPPDYFKIDVEGFEYDIFTQMMTTPELLPVQIQVELHWATRMTGLSWMPRTRSSAEIALLTGLMFNAGGYMPASTDFNPHCTSCMEVLYVRAFCEQ